MHKTLKAMTCTLNTNYKPPRTSWLETTSHQVPYEYKLQTTTYMCRGTNRDALVEEKVGSKEHEQAELVALTAEADPREFKGKPAEPRTRHQHRHHLPRQHPVAMTTGPHWCITVSMATRPHWSNHCIHDNQATLKQSGYPWQPGHTEAITVPLTTSPCLW